MIIYETKEFEANNIFSRASIEDRLGVEVANELFMQIKKDINKIGIGKEIFPSDILGENSGSWRREYEAVYNHFKEQYEGTDKNAWDESRKYIGRVFKYVIHNECEGDYIIYDKEKFGNVRKAYLRIN